MNIQWYVNRLRRMSVPEIGYRGNKAVHSRLQQWGIGAANSVPTPDFDARTDRWFAPSRSISKDRYLVAADQILAGKQSIFALVDVDTGFPPRWNRDYRTGTEAPLVFGKALDYRNEGLVGDIKYLWEPNRHLQLVTLAQAYFLSNDSSYLDGLSRCLFSWFEQCPYGKGPNWVSALELAIRLINWSIAWNLIGGLSSPIFEGERGQELKRVWVNGIYQHAHFIRGYFSRYSSANNHLIGEAAGLLVASTTWPYWKVCRQWRSTAMTILEEEVVKQITADGVDREQTTSYQQFVFEFLLVSGLSARRAGSDFSSTYWQRLERMAEFILAIRDCGGNVPMIGDADDGYVTRLDPAPQFEPFRSVLGTAAILFDRADFRRAAGTVDDRNLWLFGEMGRQKFDDMAQSDAHDRVPRAFFEAGYFVLVHRERSPDEIKIVIDAGPLGYSAIAAHGHADALAFTLSIGGHEILIDPGTYAYHTQKKWRDYFRGTSAHNTVRIDREDQSIIGGNFMWMRHARARCLKFTSTEDDEMFDGIHDGFLRLRDPVSHRRSLVLDKRNLEIEIVDTLECKKNHFVEQFWHFAEDVDVTVNARRVVARRGNRAIKFHFSDTMTDIETVRGNETIPLGWVSRRFDVKHPTTTLICSGEINGATSLITKIACE